MEVIKAMILGIIQGLTEFLPVSSSGHLVLFENILGLTEGGMLFTVILHVGTLIPVIIVYWQDILPLIKRPFQKTTFLIVAATIPTVIVALLFKDAIESLFDGSVALGINFIITAAVLLFSDSIIAGDKRDRHITYVDAGTIGVMQAIAIMPAISRSGMTIVGGLVRGLDRPTAAKFSFLMSIPAILGGLVLTLKDFISAPQADAAMGIVPMAAGFLMAAVSGYFAVRFMLRVINKGRLRYFSYYVGILGILILMDHFVLHLYF